ncbi:hypothetical protein CNMCM6936_001989 [Aspergillus lentulus]|nr:hypothetical protein CNMCM6936_001989 [Aspergillus lentulus]
MGSEAIWDFVIVGGGPAGCALAVDLARATTHLQVLLLEAGMQGDDKSLRVDGKVLGGSTTINFSVFTVGARDDYDEWATVVGDELYKWDRMQPRFRRLETFDTTISDLKNAKYGGPKSSDHGSQGALRVGFASEWEQDLPLMLDVFEQAGLVRNPDSNSGNPIGMALMVNSAHKGRRTTAADLLDTAPENLTIITESPVQRIVLDGKKAIGVKCNGKLCKSSNLLPEAGDGATLRALGSFSYASRLSGVVKDYSYVCMGVFLMNEQSSGEVRLQSSNPDDPLLFDPKFFSHSFDRRACIEILRDALQVTKHGSFQKDTVAPMVVPPSESDDDLFEFWKNTVGSVWHIVGTVEIGRPGDADAAVDSRFRVFGIENLRVADMSIVPVLLSTHLQVPAYMIGMTCAEVLVEEYDLHSAKRPSSRGCIPA